MLCNHCGVSNEIDATFCIHCGGSLGKFRRAKTLIHHQWSSARASFHDTPLLQALSDLSFKQFVSFKIVKMTYALSLSFAGLIALGSIIAGFYRSLFLGSLMLFIGAPLIFLLIVLYSRVLLEVVLFNFKTSDREAETREQPETTDHIEWNV